MSISLSTRHLRIATMLATLPVLLGMDGGCVYSQQPVGNPQNSFTDHYLVGEWYAFEIADDLAIDYVERAYTISYADSALLEIRSYMEGEPWLVHRGNSTRIGASKFISLRLHECPDCEAEELQDFSPDACPYLVYSYQTFMPATLKAGFAEKYGLRSDAVLNKLQDLRGNLLFTRTLHSSYFADAVEDHVLEGDEFGDKHVCLAAGSQSVRDFLMQNDPDAYYEWQPLIRGPDTVPALTD